MCIYFDEYWKLLEKNERGNGMTNLGNRLKQVREDNGKSKEEVSTYLDIAPRSYGRYETGERVPDLETMIRLASYFGCSLDYLVGVEIQVFGRVLARDQVWSYKDITDKGYNGKLAHGLIKEIVHHQTYQERVRLSDNDQIKYVSKDDMRQLLMRLLADFGG